MEFNYLIENSKAVITDSGGITKTTVMGIPCRTLRNSIESPKILEIGTNELLSVDTKTIGSSMRKLFNGGWKKEEIPELWDGKTVFRIVKHIRDILQ